MAFYDSSWYCNFGNGISTGYYAVTMRPQNAAVAAGVLRRQFTAPAVGSERVFVCIIAGTTANVIDATWVLTRGAKTTDGTVTWQECTGASAVNGDLTNTPNWTQAKAIGTPTLGAIIKRNNGASYQICTTAGSLGASEPGFSDTAGVTTTETAGTTVWTSLGPVGNFTGGQAPHARLANACTAPWFVAGNTIYVGDNHAESQATAIAIAPSGTATTMGKILCHNHSGSYPPSDLMTGAAISTTAAVAITLNPSSGSFYIYGLTFIVGVGASTLASLALSSSNAWLYYDSCSFQIASTGATSVIQVGSSNACTVIFNNTTVKFANVGQYVDMYFANFTWQNTGQVLVSGSSIPTYLISTDTNGKFSTITLEAVDLNQITGTIFGNAAAIEMGSWLIKDCKLNSGVTITSAIGFPGQQVQTIRADSGATAYKSARYTFDGTETTETSITRVGGAVDPTGQAQSRKIVTSANVQWLRPFQAEPYAIWNATTGAIVTVTIYGTINVGAVPNNDDLWLEVEYLGSSATPLGSIVTTTKASLLAANAAISADGSSWNGGGSGAGWSPFKLVATLSSPQPGMVGYIDVRVRAAKASTTYYLDPKIELT